MKKRYTFIIPILFLIASSLHAQTTWNWVNPRPQGNMLLGAAFDGDSLGIAVGPFGTIVKRSGSTYTVTYPTTRRLSAATLFHDSLWVVGDSGTILFSTNWGNTWSQENGASGRINLNSVVAFNKDYVFAVGDSGYIYYTNTAGANNFNRMTSGTTRNLNDVALDSAHLYVVGDNGTLLRGKDLALNGWTSINTRRKMNYNGIAIDHNNIFIVGDSNYIMQRETTTDTLVRDTVIDYRYNFNDVVVHEDTVIVVGTDGAIKRSINLGRTWSSINLGITNNLLHIEYSDDSNAVFIFGDKGIMLKSRDNGASWMRLDTGSYDAIYALARTPNNVLYGSSGNGYIFRSTNGGSIWTRDSLNASVIKQPDIAFGRKFGLMSTYGSSVMVTVDSGRTWTTVSLPTSTTLGVTVINDSVGLVSAAIGKMFRTTNMGTTWTSITTGVSNSLYDVESAPGVNTIAVGFNGEAIYSTDNGLTWTHTATNSTAQFNRVRYMPTGSTAIAVGAAGAMRQTTNGGVTWTSITSGTRQNLNDLKWQGNNAALVSGDSGVVLKSTNGGQSWTKDYIRTTDNLYAALITGPNTAFVAGANSDILNTSNSGLPVELLTMSGERISEHSAALSWSVAREVNNLGYRVERLDENNWTKVGFVNGVGTTSVQQNYAFTDATASTESVTYRIMQVDLNGTESSLGMIEVAPYMASASTTLSLYPNPAREKSALRFNLQNDEHVVISIYNTLGEKIATVADQNLNRGSHIVALPTAGLAQGIYLIQAQIGQQQQSIRLSIAR